MIYLNILKNKTYLKQEYSILNWWKKGPKEYSPIKVIMIRLCNLFQPNSQLVKQLQKLDLEIKLIKWKKIKSISIIKIL